MRLAIFIFLLLAALPALAQPTAGVSQTARYWVRFADKNGVAFAPQAYFTPAAQARRQRQHLPPADATDYPVRPDYVAAVQAHADTLTLVSRWFNAVACRATPTQAAALARLPGVIQVQPWPMRGHLRPASRFSLPVSRFSLLTSQEQTTNNEQQTTKNEQRSISPNDYLLARQQTAALGRTALGRAGLTGQGVRIAVLDVGFRGVNHHSAFRALRREGRIAATRDFLKNRPSVYLGGGHGTEVLGCLAGRLPGPDSLHQGPALGLAPAATYLLARTEGLLSERFSEEEAWLAAMEWADQQGADIISSSLAYTEQRYFPEQMDGRHSLVGRAATLAARKGMLVVSAAGNDGDDDWTRIGTPADADSVLAVGGLDPATGLHLGFSSVGPSADRRLKPDVSAFGIVLTATATGGYERVEGTSFAAPLVAGLAACARQASGHKLTAMELYRHLRQAGELYPYYDYAHGYGRPEAARLLAHLQGEAPAVAPTFDFVAHDTLVAVVLRPQATVPPARPLPLLAEPEEAGASLPTWLATPGAASAPPPGTPTPTHAAPVGQERVADAEPALPPYPSYPTRLYWHLTDGRGVLHRYEVRATTQRLVVQVPRRLVRGGEVLRVYYQGYVGEYRE